MIEEGKLILNSWLDAHFVKYAMKNGRNMSVNISLFCGSPVYFKIGHVVNLLQMNNICRILHSLKRSSKWGI